MWIHNSIDALSAKTPGLHEPAASRDTPLYRAAIRQLVTKFPNVSSPLRIAFLGQETYFRSASCEGSSEDWNFRFFALDPWIAKISDWNHVEALATFAPHVIVFFRPERQAFLVQELGRQAFVIGVFTEPLARNNWSRSEDLKIRRRNYLDARDLQLDSIICAVPHYTKTLSSIFSVDSTVPLPVHDSIFRTGALPKPHPSSGIFVGQITERRRYFLQELKNRYSWTVIDHGTQWINPTPFSIGINIHAGNFANHEHRIFCHMASGQVLLDEPTSFHYGMFPGTHRLVFNDLHSLLALVNAIEADPRPAQRIQIRALSAIEKYRSSRVWPRVILSLIAQRSLR